MGIEVKIFTLSFFSVLLLSSCQSHRYNYDAKMLQLMELASRGDSAAALDAYDYCTSELKLYPGDLGISDFAGACGGMLALAIENSLANGDPLEIKKVLDYVALAEGDSKRRMKFYRSVARMTIKVRCSEKNPPDGCKNKELISEY